MARRVRGQQRTVLEPLDAPPPGFLQSFKASHNLSRAMSTERKVVGVGQIELLKRGADQRAWVDAARMRSLPPPEHVVLQQRLASDLKKHCVSDVQPASERPAQHARRMDRQEAFLEYRRGRHDAAIKTYEQDMKSLMDDCEVGVQTAEETLEAFFTKAEARIERLLGPLEVESEELGKKSEQEIRNVYKDLERVADSWKAQNEAYAATMGRVERKREESGNALRRVLINGLHDAGHWVARKMVEMLPEAGHMVEGDIDTVDEVREEELRRALRDRQEAIKERLAELREQLAMKTEDNERRWKEGVLLWRRLRHREAIRKVMERIESPEFDQPEKLVQMMANLREQQSSAFTTRQKLLDQCFTTRIQDLKAHHVRAWEDQSNKFNDAATDAFDNMFADLKNLKDELALKGDDMLRLLGDELEQCDARQEWGEHETAQDLVDAEVRPHLTKRLDFVDNMLTTGNEALTQQDELQQHILGKILGLFKALGKEQEELSRKLHEVDFNYQGELSDHEKDFEEECAENERNMTKFRQDINDAVTVQELDELKVKTFEFLDDMAVRYRKHTDNVIAVHHQYPESAMEVFQEELFHFSSKLGLVPESQMTIKLPAEGEEDGEPEEPPQLQEWISESAGGVGSKILELQALPTFREEVLCLHELQEDEDEQTKEEEEQQAAAGQDPQKADDAEGGEEEQEGEQEEPLTGCAAVLMADRSPALLTLAFENSWLDESFSGLREAVFFYLSKWFGRVTNIDVADDCETESRKLDQLLSKHTNRKGEVQVDWYVPRYGVISKHKDKFERHIVATANKNRAMEKSTDDLHKEMEEREASYKEKLKSLVEKLAQCETLPALSAVERQCHEEAQRFQAACQDICSKLLHLATKGPQGLQQENDALMKVCRSGAEQYSQKEIEFYSSEVSELNAALEEKSQARIERLKALEAQLPDQQKLPVEDFNKSYADAVEALSAGKGLGRKHGEQRRKAQERCRTLVSRAMTARQNIETLLSHFQTLCSVSPQAAMYPQEFPQCSLFKLQDHIASSDQPWVYASELTGVLYILMSALNFLGSSLQAYREPHADKFKTENLPQMCVLKEEEVLVTNLEEEMQKVETSLRQDCLLQVLGPLMTMDMFNKEIESIVASGHQAYKEKNTATPDFMLQFFEEMRASVERARLDIIHGIRQGCAFLRDEGLLELGDALFGRFMERAVYDLQKEMKLSQASMQERWRDLDAERAVHEKRLNPGLANPNAEEKLLQLVEEEKARRQRVTAALAEDRTAIATGFRSHADSFVSRLQSNFETAVRIVDALPLLGQFIDLPGEEGAEAPKMSVKRRMRRLQNNATAEQHTDKLPPRAWEGFPQLEIRQSVSAGKWPADGSFEGKSEEEVKELATATVESCRSPFHKRLFERRNFYYQRFKAEFDALVKRCDADLSEREDKEHAKERTWEAAVKQLKASFADDTLP